MKYVISIFRRDFASSISEWQDFNYITDNENDTVATALNQLNSTDNLRDANGNTAKKIKWECSCLQKKCGACAMVINGYPKLACDAVLAEYKKGKISVEPLRKFPVIEDLIVDRSILYENLKTLKLWFNNKAVLNDKNRELAYEASECIQCGCCLEICPNFIPEGVFFGMSAVPITTRLLSEMSPAEYKEIAKLYDKHIFEGCGKSLSCKNVCPKHIDTEKLLINSNHMALWKLKFGK